jgi:hypothetical protein
MKAQMENKQQKLIDFNKPFKELQMLRNLGLREDEIAYLVWLKAKQTRRAHWKD